MKKLDSSASNAGAWRKDFAFSIAAKLGTTIPAALVGLVATRELTSSYEAAGFALFSLVSSIPTLLPFADIGLGGTVTQTVSTRRTLGTPAVGNVISRAVKYLLLIGTAIAMIGWIGALYGIWPRALGILGNDVNLSAAVVFSIFGITMPAVVGYRILQGLQLNRVVTLLQGMSGIVGSVFVLAAAASHAPLWIVVSLPGLSGFLLALVACMVARRKWTSVIQESRRSVSSKITKPAKIRIGGMAWPLAVIAISAPLAYQSDRLILGNVSDADQIAMYAAAFQLYGPANALVVTAGQTLWPRFSGLREVDGPGSYAALLRSLVLFATLGASLAIVMPIFGPPVTDWSTNGLAPAGPELFAAFGILLFLNSLLYPLGMFMMDTSGLRFQAICLSSMAAFKIVLSIPLARELGATGPVIGSIIGVAVCVLIPCWLRVNRGRKKLLNKRGI